MRFIHIADLHLGSRPEAGFSWGEGRGEELWSCLAAVIDACNDKEVDLLLIAGDLFDRPPVWEEAARANELFGRLKETQVVMIAGDCDYIAGDDCRREYPWHPWVHLLADKYPQPVYLGELDTSVVGCSYQQPEVVSPYLEDAVPDSEGEIQILLGHTGDSMHMPADLKELSRAGFDYIALGHSHKPQLLPQLRLAFCGSTEPLNKTETGKHGFVIGELGGEKPVMKFMPFASREYMNLKVRISSDTSHRELEEQLAAAMAAQGSRNIYRICLEGRFMPGRPYDAGRLMALGNVVEVVDETIPDYNLVELVQDHGDDVIGMYLEEFLKEPAGTLQQKAMYLGLEALLTGDKAAEQKGVVDQA